jgi:hypothetical protein
MPVATSIVMDVVSLAWSRAVSLRRGAPEHTSIQYQPRPVCQLSDAEHQSSAAEDRFRTHNGRSALAAGIALDAPFPVIAVGNAPPRLTGSVDRSRHAAGDLPLLKTPEGTSMASQ